MADIIINIQNFGMAFNSFQAVKALKLQIPEGEIFGSLGQHWASAG